MLSGLSWLRDWHRDMTQHSLLEFRSLGQRDP